MRNDIFDIKQLKRRLAEIETLEKNYNAKKETSDNLAAINSMLFRLAISKQKIQEKIKKLESEEDK